MQKLLLFLIFIVPFVALSQQIERVEVKGVITAPADEDLEAISIYNVSSQKGTITNDNGEFTIEVAINDRVLFSALQFQKFTVIVDEGIVANRVMKIYVNPAIFQLDEVIVRPHDLTGNIVVDAARIKTSDPLAALNLSWEDLEYGFEFSDDKSSGVTNSALDKTSKMATEHIGTVNLLGFVGLLGETLFKNRKNSAEKRSPLERAQISDVSYTAIYQRFPKTFFTDLLQIPEISIENFIYFILENGFTTDLLKENNELKLMDFLEKQSKIYLKTSE
ncbi:MAG: carboxypeptidase-like regulatory domain-containing protein [Flavobacteriaceae bacterium]|nr:carboxypeptidase-like regulatory domain-containing protein [Flavobacteriaceae bacterium]